MYENIIQQAMSEMVPDFERIIEVNCIFNCKFFSTTTLEIWQLLLQTFIVKLSGFLRRSRYSFSFSLSIAH